METKKKRGDVRNDGKVFWSYNRGLEWWIDPEKFAVKVHKARKCARNWNLSNPEKHAIAKAKSYEKHREKTLCFLKKWREQNRDRVRDLNRDWLDRNPERAAELNSRRRARKRNATPPDSWSEAVVSCFIIAKRVSGCLKIRHVVDHIFPLSRGGTHCHRNLQIIPASLNQEKHALTKVVLPSCYRSDGWSINGPASLEPNRAK